MFDMCKHIPNEDSAVKRLRRKILYSAVLRGKNKFLLDCFFRCPHKRFLLPTAKMLCDDKLVYEK
ncbi:MAG: hypothetical protein IJ011_07705 [Clostridia bacterium]|nr:hypothetical protein [Clostridia bacterium]